MKKLMLFLLLFCAFQSSVFAGYVRGSQRRDGTNVPEHNRSNPNQTVIDNFSHKGNYNPDTGKIGSNRDRSSPSSEYYDPSYQPRRSRSKFGF